MTQPTQTNQSSSVRHELDKVESEKARIISLISTTQVPEGIKLYKSRMNQYVFPILHTEGLSDRDDTIVNAPTSNMVVYLVAKQDSRHYKYGIVFPIGAPDDVIEQIYSAGIEEFQQKLIQNQAREFDPMRDISK